MEFKKYYIESKNGKSNCVVRSLCKILNKEYEEVFNELVNIAHELNCESFNDIPVFEKYMNNYHINKINSNEIQIKELNLGEGSYIILCYDQKDYYHMIPIIDNIIYDKSNECLNLYVINIYKKENWKNVINIYIIYNWQTIIDNVK